MSRAEAFEAVAALIRRTFHAPNLAVSDGTTADDVDGWDSLSHATLLLRIEKHFNLRIPDDVAYALRDVGQLVDSIFDLVSQRSRGQAN
jgi:acyl carrier protein